MCDRRAIAGIVVVFLIAAAAGPTGPVAAGTRGYFACPVLMFFGACPSLEASDPEPPPRSSAPGPRPVESPWAEPRAGADGGGHVYVPPKPVREFLELPTPERARAYLAWNQARLRAIERAAEVLRGVSASDTSAIGDGPSPECAVPAASVSGTIQTVGEEATLAAILAPADFRRASHGITILHAFASWCPYSARQTTVMEAWARSRPDVPVTALLFDSPPGVAAQFDALPFPVRAGSRALRERLGIRSYPTLVVFKNGTPVERLAGLTPAARLEAVTRALGT